MKKIRRDTIQQLHTSVMETKHNRQRKTQVVESIRPKHKESKLLPIFYLFRITYFSKGITLQNQSPDSLYPFQLFLIKVIESPQTSSNHFKISFETPFRCKHRLSSSDQWSDREDNSNIGKICSESERLTLEMVGLTIYHKSDSFATIVIARAQRLHHLRHSMVEVPITHLQTEIGKLNSLVQN